MGASEINPKKEIAPKYVFRSSIWVLIGSIFQLQFILLVIFSFVEMFLLTENVAGQLYVQEILFYIVLQVIHVVVLSWIILEWFVKKYIIVSDKIIVKKGIFNPKETIHLFKNIESMHLKKTFLGVLFGYGSILIYLPILQQKSRLDRIGKPQKYIQIIEQYMAHFKEDERAENVLIQS